MPKKRVLDLALWTKDPDGAGPQLSHQKQCEKDAQEKRAAGEKVPATYCDPAPTNLLWYMKGTLLPRLALTDEGDGAFSEVLLTNVAVNTELEKGIFEIALPAGWDEKVSEYEDRRDNGP